MIVLGVSRDGIVSHEKFAKKYQLNFSLLSDPNGDVIKDYNAWGKKNLWVKNMMELFVKHF